MRPARKILITVAIVVAGFAGIYALAYHMFPPPNARIEKVAEAAKPAAPATATAAAAPAAAPAATAGPSVMDLYEACVRGAWPNAADAEKRSAACSKALQTRELQPAEVALARLTRGIARSAIGDKMLATEDYTEALKHYDGAIDPRNPDALNLYRRAASLDALGQTDRALADYSEAIRVDPKGSLAFLGRGVLLASRKRSYDRAIEDFSRAIELEPKNADAYIARGNAYSQIGDNGRAIADLDKAIAIAPDDAQAYVVRGLAYNRRNEIAPALRDYTKALEIDPRIAAALANRAAIYAYEGKQDLAIRDLDQAISIEPDNPVALYNRGYAHFAKGEYDKAIDDYSKAIELDPTMGVAYNNRCLSRAISGKDLVSALADCDQALKLNPLNLDTRDTRGFIYLKLGDPLLAVTEYNAALDIDPNRPLALYGRGIARVMSGQTRDGEADKAAAMTLNPEVDKQFSTYGIK
ncbi:MAG: tetratricopeptide repeat protein [Reyranella sp.]|nr:MAG: tetratricopeptide repeat protein [Reyranella sp.]